MKKRILINAGLIVLIISCYIYESTYTTYPKGYWISMLIFLPLVFVAGNFIFVPIKNFVVGEKL